MKLVDLRNKLVIILIILVLISITTNSQSLYKVSGKVFLEDNLPGGSHEGVKVRFYTLPGKILKDSTLSLADGSYLKNISPGYYLVEWTKSGYVFEELGGLALAKDTVLADVTLIPGEIQYVSGDVYGTWTRNFVYIVTGDITIPTGQILTINPGVRVKFSKNTGLVCGGRLIAEGTETQRIKFTSKESSPLPGDWKSIAIYSEYNRLKYVDYDFASDGFNGSNAGNNIFENVRILGSLSQTARGIYFTNSSNMTVKNCQINTGGDYGVYIGFCGSSVIIGNKIKGNYSQAAIFTYQLSGGRVDSNIIEGSAYSGIHSEYSSNSTFSNNTISGFSRYGIYYPGSNDCFLVNNIIQSSDYSNEKMAVYNVGGSNFCTIRKNKINLRSDGNSNLGIYQSYGIVDSNIVVLEGNSSLRGIIAHSSRITNNIISLFSDGNNGGYAVESDAVSSNRSLIAGNTITLKKNGHGIKSSYATVTDNVITVNEMTSADYVYYAFSDCKMDSILNNSVRGMNRGFYTFNSGNVIIENNQMFLNVEVMKVNNSNVTIRKNLFFSNFMGIKFENQSTGSLVNNTIVRLNESIDLDSSFAIHISGNSNPSVANNIIQGFSYGIFSDNTLQNFNIRHNNLWRIKGSLFSGTAMPPLIGQFIDQNANGDSSDIYKNVMLDPGFIDPNSNYHLQSTSRMINAGDPTILDPDNTISDIGAYSHFIWVSVAHQPVGNTANTSTPYQINADVYSPVGNPVTAKLFYRLNGGSFSELAMTNTSGRIFGTQIPAQALGTFVEYYIEGTDGTNITRSPGLAPVQLHSFTVTLIQQYSGLNGVSNSAGKIVLNWDDPQLVSGTISNLGVYRSATPYVTQSNLYSSLNDTSNNFIDENVTEGDVFYYRIGATINYGGGSVFLFVSNEKSVMSDAVGYVLVKGKASLKDTSNFAGIMIEFERTSPSPIKRDTVYTDANGNFKYIPTAGIYNINVKKAGWLPLTIPEKILTANTILDSVSLKRGSVVSISGNVSGRWLSAFAYNVTGNLTVNAGDTLFIEKGTLVKFTDNFNLTVNGVLIADGDSLERIEFTSGKTVNRAGDWGSIILNAPGSVIRYANYKYATNGIYGNNASRTIIEYCNFGNMVTAANGVVFSNSRDLRINHNDFQLIQGNGIYAPYARASQFNYNILNTVTTFAAIFCEDSDSSQINYNEIKSKPYGGIRGNNIEYVEIIGNDIQCQNYGLHFQNSSFLNIRENTILESIEYAIYSEGGGNNTIYKNTIKPYGNNYGYVPSPRYAIKAGSFSIIRRNNITYNKVNYTPRIITTFGNSTIDSNYLLIDCENLDCAIYSPSSIVAHNTLRIDIASSSYSNIAINTPNDGTRSSIIGNYIYSNGFLQAINASNTRIFGNTIHISRDGRWAVELLGNCSLVQNKLSIFKDAIRSTQGISNSILSNDIHLSGSGSGMELTNSSVKEVLNNTLTSDSTGIGILLRNLTNPAIIANTIQGFSTGLQTESQITNISFNNFFNNTNNFSGPGLPPALGQISTVNANGTPSDVYNNIFENPSFVDAPNKDFRLTRNSPLINAGDPTKFDPDGTISDIGAYFYNFGFVPSNLKADSTGDGSVSLSWSVEPTDSLTGFKVLYKTESGFNWTYTDLFTGTSKKIEGLTNNANYIFAVKAVYGSIESNLSKSITVKPGVGSFWTQRYIVAVQEVNNNIQKSLALNNQGNRDVSFIFKTPFDNQYISVSDTTGFVFPSGSKNINLNYNGSVDGVRFGDLTIQNNSNNDPEHKVSYLQVVGTGHLNNLTPVKFTPVTSTAKVFYLVINSAWIDGMNLSTGDEIALYSGNLCVGAGKFTGQLPMIIKGYGADAGSGFVEGDSLVIKSWQLSTNRYSFMNSTLLKGSNLLFDGAFAAVDLQGSIYLNEKIHLVKNKFNLISSYLLPRNSAANSFFGNIPSLKIAYEDNGSAFIPQYNINTIGNIDITEGYHVFVTDSVMLNIEGVEVETVNYPLFIEKSRFNSISYLYSTPMSIEYAFNSIRNRIKIVQDDKGGVWIPSLNLNTIGNLIPGSGYQIFSDSSVSFSYKYPALPAQLAKNPPVFVKKEPAHYKIESTGLPYTIAINGINLGNTQPEEGDEIAVFDGTVCVGVTVWQPEIQNFVTAWGGNEDAGLAGFKAGNKIFFKYYAKKTDAEHTLTAIFSSKGEEVFLGAAFAGVTLTSESALIPEEFLLYNNYPNPFNPSTTIKFDLPENSKVSLVIYNLLGEKVRTLVNSVDYKPGKFSMEWNGRDNNGITAPSGIYLIRFETEKYQSVKKAILLK